MPIIKKCLLLFLEVMKGPAYTYTHFLQHNRCKAATRPCRVKTTEGVGLEFPKILENYPA